MTTGSSSVTVEDGINMMQLVILRYEHFISCFSTYHVNSSEFNNLIFHQDYIYIINNSSVGGLEIELVSPISGLCHLFSVHRQKK